MAGDWIKMRECLHEDPAVLRMATKLSTRPEHVVGYCHKFWSWVSRNCHDGSVTGVTLPALGSVLSMPDFPEMLCEVGWLKYTEIDGEPRISIPKFDRHLSEGAKARGLAAERQRNVRVTKTSRSQRDKSVTREEKRREDKEELSLPAILNTETFQKTLADWKSYHKPYKPVAWAKMIARAANLAEAHGLPAVCAAMDRAMANGWTGWDQESSFQQRNGAPVVGHKPEYRQVELRVFNAHAKQGDFLIGPKRDSLTGYSRVFGQLKSKAKIESHTDPNWAPTT